MSEPREPHPVKLIMSLFSSEEDLLDGVILRLEGTYGRTEWRGPPLLFDRTTYYAREMGWPLHRRFVSFESLIPPERLVEVKLDTNALEKQYLRGDSRRVNIDPGYLAPERLVLATGKNYTHRIYLAKGIYGDLTLVFHKGAFRTLPWTYRDYADAGLVQHFQELRERYMDQLRRMGRLG
jgi:hypothetical protein